MFLRIVRAVVQQRNIRSRLNVGLQQFIKVLHIHHVAGNDHHIRAVDLLNAFHVFQKGCNIIVVNIVIHTVFRKQHMDPPPLGVNVVMTPGADMLNERAGLSADIDLNPVNPAVAEV